MKIQFLLPHICKNVGWALFIPFFATGIIYLFIPGTGLERYDWIEELLVIGLAISLIMTAFSHEKDEDEYTSTIRSRYLTLAFYIDLIILTVATITIDSFDYLNVMAIQMFLVLFLYIIMFNVAMHRLRRLYKTKYDEEQD